MIYGRQGHRVTGCRPQENLIRHIKEFDILTDAQASLAWLKGKSAGRHGFYHGCYMFLPSNIAGFLWIFPLNQSIDPNPSQYISIYLNKSQ
jgi:hypothetical protein